MDFTRLTDYMDYMPKLNVPGCDLAVYRDHELIYRHQSGWRDLERTTPIRGDEAYMLCSATKVFTSCAAMQLIEQGKLRLDDPVSEYLPAYAHLTVKEGETIRPAKTVMTVRHLMSMQSGLNYNSRTPAIEKVMEANHRQATTRQIVEAKAEDPLEFDPGTDFLYSFSHDVLAAVIEVVSGQRFSAYLREHIWEPLDIYGMSFRLDDALNKRLCPVYNFDSKTNTLKQRTPEEIMARFNPEYESGGGGLIGGVEDYIKFADALACGGQGKDGAHILSPEMIQLWSANQLCPKGRKTFDVWHKLGYSYALGVRTRVNNRIGGPGALGEFGWDGAAGAYVMIDPSNHLSAFFGMHVMNNLYNYDVIHPTLRRLIYEGL